MEEYLFYFTGFVAVLLIYIWLDEYWLAAYTIPVDAAQRTNFDRLLRFHPQSLILGVVLYCGRDPLPSLFCGDGRLFRLFHIFWLRARSARRLCCFRLRFRSLTGAHLALRVSSILLISSVVGGHTSRCRTAGGDTGIARWSASTSLRGATCPLRRVGVWCARLPMQR